MTSDVTIHISLGTGETTQVSNATQATSDQSASSAGPSPMALDQLQVSASGVAPGPQSTEELAAATSTTQVSAGEPPPPMSVEQLQMTTSAAAPGPQALTELGAVEGADGPPPPIDPDQLGEADTSEEGEAPRGGRRRKAE